MNWERRRDDMLQMPLWCDSVWLRQPSLNRGGGLRHYLSPTYTAVLSSLPRQLNSHSHLDSPTLLTHPYCFFHGNSQTHSRWNLWKWCGRHDYIHTPSDMCSNRLCTRRPEGRRQQWWQCEALPSNSKLSAPFIVVQRSPWKMSLDGNST